jgi:hypothetical protein
VSNFVSRVAASSSAAVNSIATGTQAHAAGSLLVAIVRVQNFFTAPPVTNTAGDTWSTAVDSYGVGANQQSILYTITAGHASDIVTATFSAGPYAYASITVYEFSSPDATPLLDADVDGATGTAMSTPSLTVGGVSAVIIAGGFHSSGTVTAGTGYTLVNWNYTGDSNNYLGDEYHEVSANEAPSMTGGSSAAWEMVSAAFKLTPAGSSSVSPSVSPSSSVSASPSPSAGPASYVFYRRSRR